MENSDGEFKWQAGYGVLSVSERNLEKVKAYAANQKEHHRENMVVPFYETIDEEE